MNDTAPVSFFHNELYELDEFLKWLSKRHLDNSYNSYNSL